MSKNDDPPNSARPCGVVTVIALTRFLLSCACQPSTVTISLTFNVVLVHPYFFSSTPGLPNSAVQSTGAPTPSLALMCNTMCGVLHSILVSVPVNVTDFFQSNSAANW